MELLKEKKKILKAEKATKSKFGSCLHIALSYKGQCYSQVELGCLLKSKWGEQLPHELI